MSKDFEVTGRIAAAVFTLKLHRGDGMVLIAMNWKKGQPPADFVGFAIDYHEPGGDRWWPVKNRLSFETAPGTTQPRQQSSRVSPIQMFRWIHFPFHAELPGPFNYRVTPVFMNSEDVLSYGTAQTCSIELARETYPAQLNVAFTRGFVSSQAFVDHFQAGGPIATILPGENVDPLTFVPKHPQAKQALDWMGFEARSAILEVLDEAVADKKAQVRMVAYELSEPEVVDRLERLGDRLTIVIDDSTGHGGARAPETLAAKRLSKAHVKRQHMRRLQHNKTIVVSGPTLNKAVCGSTNFSWRGFFVQNNNALIVTGKQAIKPFLAAFDEYWLTDTSATFGASAAAEWADLGLTGIDAKISFSPHSSKNALLATIASDIGEKTKSSLFYSLAFLYQTKKGPLLEAINTVTNDTSIFVLGISDAPVGGIKVQSPDGNLAPVSPAALGAHLPKPFSAEPAGGSGIRLHHKFVVIDFDKPTARVYLGSYNFSEPADKDNGENLLLIRDRRIAVSYAIEAVRIFDHYYFRQKQKEAATARTDLTLRTPPRKPGDEPWWKEHYTVAEKIRDRELFA
jgi:phosphatidylserine/phosphatidylglycerophosphate/cardiolipin synthase-like enzyme